MDATLPSYDEHQAPAYVARHQHIEHTFPLKPNSCNAWATLKLNSAASSPWSEPLYTDGDSITGSLEIDLQKKEHMEQIDIRIMGQIIQPMTKLKTIQPFERGPDILVEVSQPLWSGDASKTLNGKHTFPFNLAIPRETLKGLPLPSSTRERNAGFGVRYEVFAHIRTGFLRSDHRIGCVVSYISGKKPEVPGPLRQLAYENDTAIPGPKEDPDHWKTLETVIIGGNISNKRDVKIECQLSLATPLCYTKGTAIPCAIRFESSDEEALKLLSTPGAINLRLQRLVTWGACNASQHSKEALYNKYALDYPSRATWGPVSGQGNQRRLEGEIQFPTRIQASLSHEKYSISYNVTLFASEATGFKPQEKCPVLTESIEITNVYANGPRAKHLLPPRQMVSTIEYSPFCPETEVIFMEQFI